MGSEGWKTELSTGCLSTGKVDRQGFLNFYCHYCTPIPLLWVCNESWQYTTTSVMNSACAVWLLTPYCQKPPGFATRLQHSISGIQPLATGSPTLLSHPSLICRSLGTTALNSPWQMWGSIMWFKERRKLLITTTYFGACLRLIVWALQKATLPSCIQQIWTRKDSLQVQVYLLKSTKQQLQNYSDITAIIDKVKVYFTPTIKLNSYVLVV